MVSDAQLLSEFYTCGKKRRQESAFADIRKEAADLGSHVFKLPSYFALRMCIPGAGPICAACATSLTARQATSPLWSPETILRPLKPNQYRMYMPVPEDDAARPTPTAPSGDIPQVSSELKGPEDVVGEEQIHGPYRAFSTVLADGVKQTRRATFHTTRKSCAFYAKFVSNFIFVWLQRPPLVTWRPKIEDCSTSFIKDHAAPSLLRILHNF